MFHTVCTDLSVQKLYNYSSLTKIFDYLQHKRKLSCYIMTGIITNTLLFLLEKWENLVHFSSHFLNKNDRAFYNAAGIYT